MRAEPEEELSGGGATVFDATENAFGLPVQNLAKEKRAAFFVGNSFFKQNWVVAPASTAARDGLGPIFNTRSCSACHLKDGRGRPPEGDEEFVSLLLRLGIPGQADADAGVRPEPTYGSQLQDKAVPGARPEGKPVVEYEEAAGRFPDGESYALRRPAYRVDHPGHGALHPEMMISPRIAPHIAGMGLLEAVPEKAVLAMADPEDLDGDGISGRPNTVWDVEKRRRVMGRFGWKANTPTVRQQVAGAFHEDIGITSGVFSHEALTDAQADLAAFRDGGEPEISDEILDKVVLYTTALAVPARRNINDPKVLLGKKLFGGIGCTACHRPELATGDLEGFPELSNQTIRPYTDLLLHDMGPGLADGRPDFEASGSEWRTPPLWGLGLIPTVNKHTYLLHDGRARDIQEAILWHGGESEKSRDAYKALPKAEREALLKFLESL